MNGAISPAVQAYAVRLRPGQDLKGELLACVRKARVGAAAIVSCVGSLRVASIRLADESLPEPLEGPFEIVSLSGTLGQGQCHLHISVAGSDGRVVGGHLREGSIIYTTAEVVLLLLSNLVFERELDKATGFNELQIYQRGT